MNKNNYLLIIIGLISISGLLYSVLSKPKDTIAYVDYNLLYDTFNYKKELEKEYKQVIAQRESVIDSIRNVMHSIDLKNTDQKRIDELKQEFSTKQRQFEMENEEMTSFYNKKIFEKLNNYISEYGKEKSYKYVFANKNLVLLYADSTSDITKSLVSYINEKYPAKN